MIDVHDIEQHPDAYQTASKLKGIDIDITSLVHVIQQHRSLQNQREELFHERKIIATQGKHSTQLSAEQQKEGRIIKEKIIEVEKQLHDVEKQRHAMLARVPTIPSNDTPRDVLYKEVERWGAIPQFSFIPKSHIELGKILDCIDTDQGVAVSGSRGYYLKNEAAILHCALMMYALHTLVQKGFTPIIPPTLIKEFALFGSGYFGGTDYDPAHDEIFSINDDSENALSRRFLVGTAEPSLLSYFAESVLEESTLPRRIAGFSPCYRSEVGSYGRDTQGLYRVHEFLKVEQVIVAPASESMAEELHHEMLDITKHMYQELELPYRQIQIGVQDLGVGKFKQYDLEVWMPSRNSYGETASASNFKDWQARRLNVRYRAKDGTRSYVYMLNNTALASPRILIALLEVHQQKNGTVCIPKPLHPWMMGFTSIQAKK